MTKTATVQVQALCLWSNFIFPGSALSRTAAIDDEVSFEQNCSLGGVILLLLVQTQKGSNERLDFILARTHSMQIFGEIPFIKPQNDT